MLSSFVNCFKIPELKKKIIFTLSIIACYRIGCYIPTPGVNGAMLAEFFSRIDASGQGSIFNIMNMKTLSAEKHIAELLKVLGAAFRIKLIFSIGYGEACVCHLETLLKKRQAYISQHLMVLRDAGILETRREGKYIYYRVADHSIFRLAETAASIQGIPPTALPTAAEPGIQKDCACPKCEPELAQESS